MIKNSMHVREGFFNNSYIGPPGLLKWPQQIQLFDFDDLRKQWFECLLTGDPVIKLRISNQSNLASRDGLSLTTRFPRPKVAQCPQRSWENFAADFKIHSKTQAQISKFYFSAKLPETKWFLFDHQSLSQTSIIFRKFRFIRKRYWKTRNSHWCEVCFERKWRVEHVSGPLSWLSSVYFCFYLRVPIMWRHEAERGFVWLESEIHQQQPRELFSQGVLNFSGFFPALSLSTTETPRKSLSNKVSSIFSRMVRVKDLSAKFLFIRARKMCTPDQQEMDVYQAFTLFLIPVISWPVVSMIERALEEWSFFHSSESKLGETWPSGGKIWRFYCCLLASKPLLLFMAWRIKGRHIRKRFSGPYFPSESKKYFYFAVKITFDDTELFSGYFSVDF